MRERLLYVNFSITSDEEGERIYEEVTERLKVVKEISHRFAPQGITRIAILSSSHLALHTYPEEGYATLTITTCGDEDLFEEVLNLIASFHQINHALIS